MTRHLALTLTAFLVPALAAPLAASEPQQACSDPWFHRIEAALPTGDGQGHGPDLGSDEWMSVVEFNLGVRGDPALPDRASDAWCRYIDHLAMRTTEPAGSDEAHADDKTTGPAFDCSMAGHSSIEALICGDADLAALDREMSTVYAEAQKQAVDEQPPMLQAEQRGWIKGRNDCWKSEKPRDCVIAVYRYRIAELQASYRLVPAKGPFRFTCDGDMRNEVIVTFFQTEPPTLIAEHGDRVSLMYLQPSASGTHYVGRNESFWEHQGEALVRWGHGTAEMRCVQDQ